MGLDFTNIRDEHGAAVFFIHDGSQQDKTAFEKLAADVRTRTKKQVIVLSADEEHGRKIIQFYQLQGSHFVIIVRDDDQLHHVWSNGERFDASQIAYSAEQVG